MDVNTIGQALRFRWLGRYRELQLELKAVLEQPPRQRPEYDFIRALIQHDRGNSKDLIDYLRADRFSASDGNILARFFEDSSKRKTPRGRPRNSKAREAAMIARVFYKEWRAENKLAGIPNHRHSDQMKDEAVRFVIEELESQPLSYRKMIRELMDRSQSRRK